MSKTKKTSVVIRQMRVSDMDSVMQIKNAEHWNQTEADWLFLIESNPRLCLVAVMENQVVGTVTALNYQNKVAWIGMMLVSSDFRGKGISTLLLNSIINQLEPCVSIKLDATPAGVSVYQKLGFIKEYEISRLVSKEIKIIDSNQYLEAINLSQVLNADIANIAMLDKTLFGASRFDLLKYLSNNRKDICFQIYQDDTLKGYVFGRNGSNYIQVGPVMADSTQIAQIVLSEIFLVLNGQSVLVDVLENKVVLINWLHSIGFTYQRSFTRMYLKSNEHSGKTENQFLISGPEFG